MRNVVLTLFIGLSSITFAACGGAQPQSATAMAAAGIKAPGSAQVGDKTICPVSGEDFTVAADSPKAEVDGKTYYFCCSGCAKKFQADPKKYLDKLAKPAG
ncbi:MAG: YHS domain-containing protein [Minicystis sp.]